MTGSKSHDADSGRLDDAEQKACRWRARDLMLETKRADGHDGRKSDGWEGKNGARTRTSSSF